MEDGEVLDAVELHRQAAGFVEGQGDGAGVGFLVGQGDDGRAALSMRSLGS